MKFSKSIYWIVFLLFAVSLISNADAELEVQEIDNGSVIISELNNPAVFDFAINNKGARENFEIYSLISVSFTPKGRFVLEPGRTTIQVKVYPSEEIRSNPGFFNFEYEIKGDNSGIYKGNLLLKIVRLKDVFELDPKPLHPNASNAVVVVKNKENTHLENVEMEFESPFFAHTEKVSLEPYEQLPVEIPINKDVETLVAGPYIVTASVNLEDEKTEIEGVIDYLEDEGTSVEESNKGIIIRRTSITKKNEGNTPLTTSIEVDKDIISRLFTTYSLEPDSTARNGLSVNYVWTKALNPGESFTLDMTTNYTIPFIIIILIVVVGVMAKMYSQTALTLTKRVSYVKTTGGQFALKVNLHAKAKKHVDNVQIIDRLPGMSKLYENYGKKPDKIDHATKRLFWNMDRLSAGEERVYTYIIYSDLRVVGRFELPAATAIYEKDGKTQEVWSNKTYFASESVSGK